MILQYGRRRRRRRQQQQQQQQIMNKEIESGLDFILSHFEQPVLFPRTIMTKKIAYQRIVYSKEIAVEHFVDSDFVDCRINSFPSLKKGITWPPNLFFIDIDLKDFKSDKSLQKVLDKNLKNLKEKLDGGYPTVLETGGGYHIYQPVICPMPLEDIKGFNNFDKPSEQFLRFAKNYLSNGKADKNNNPSFRSFLLRILGSINSRYNKKVLIVQKWDGVIPLISRDFIEDFRIYLIQKKIDENEQRQKMMQLQLKEKQQNRNNNKNYYEWIDKKILTNSFEDYRKIIVN